MYASRSRKFCWNYPHISSFKFTTKILTSRWMKSQCTILLYPERSYFFFKLLTLSSWCCRHRYTERHLLKKLKIVWEPGRSKIGDSREPPKSFFRKCRVGFPWNLLTYHSGREHTSAKDPSPRISAQILDKAGKLLGAVHIYTHGRLIYSRKKLNEAQGRMP